MQMAYRDAGLALNPPPPAAAHYAPTAVPILDNDDLNRFEMMLDILVSHRLVYEGPNDRGTYGFTRFGLAFVRACQSPEK
jgi:hypothetical protein